jgi:hypothetical protein
MATNKQIYDLAKQLAGSGGISIDTIKKAQNMLMNKGNPGEAGGSTTKQKQLDSLLNMLTPEKGGIPKQRIPSPRNRGAKQSPELMPTVKLPERKVPKGEKPNMLDVAGGAKTLRVAKGGMIRKKSAKKSKKAGRAAKRGYGMAKRGK